MNSNLDWCSDLLTIRHFSSFSFQLGINYSTARVFLSVHRPSNPISSCFRQGLISLVSTTASMHALIDTSRKLIFSCIHAVVPVKKVVFQEHPSQLFSFLMHETLIRCVLFQQFAADLNTCILVPGLLVEKLRNLANGRGR